MDNRVCVTGCNEWLLVRGTESKKIQLAGKIEDKLVPMTENFGKY